MNTRGTKKSRKILGNSLTHADAKMDSVPLIAITGQVGTSVIGTDAFQECDTVGLTRSATKHNELVMTAQDLPLAIRQAFHIATTGRPGPTLVDVPKDVLINTMDWYWPTDAEVADSLPGYRPTTKGHPRMIKEAAEQLADTMRRQIALGNVELVKNQAGKSAGLGRRVEHREGPAPRAEAGPPGDQHGDRPERGLAAW